MVDVTGVARPAIIEARQLSKSYVLGGKQHPVLDRVDLSVRQGEFVTVMGPSGCGKSTLLYLLSGLEPATDGEVSFCGVSLEAMSEAQRAELRLQRMGFIFQQSHLLRQLSLLDNIVLSAYAAKKVDRKQLTARALSLMADMGIAELAHQDMTSVSGGQLQRAAICRALMNEPEIVFGDEPTGALNSSSTRDVLEILQGIHSQGTAILLVTHDAKVAIRSERILYMLDGRLVDECQLGPYESEGDLEARERKVGNWLERMGF
ncbi:ABC transporter ATP-binding protein [Paenibacillus daejeonensis]|uniref:ABC transporter ATP-binding protein n=1 Tax=Paenibacillus daejeonensis TaxID=135193 RepID=UPI00035DCB8E|nr:ABC transporter ATP-binding protein [Paenibacillus daejeonensis]